MAISTICFVIFFFTISVLSVRFRAPFYHRDSPFAPFYDPTLSETERFMRSVNRSLTRANRVSLDEFGSGINPISNLYADAGEYLMNISLGTPSFKVALVVDTGSNLLWTQCLYPRHRTHFESNKSSPSQEISYYQLKPLFDPSQSSTYKEFSCAPGSDGCPSIMDTFCDNRKACVYQVNYADGSVSHGRIASETMKLDDRDGYPFTLPNFIFGCGFENNGLFSSNQAGVVGLGLGAESLVSQLSSKSKGQFSYCLPFSLGKLNPGFINFGENYVDDLTVKIPLIVKKTSPFHFVTLNSFTIGNQTVYFSDRYGFVEQGNMIIDSGATMSYIPGDFYFKIEQAIRWQMTAYHVKSPYSYLGLCYSKAVVDYLPKFTANFAGAKSVRLSNDNFFVEVKGASCLAFLKDDDVPGFGNVALRNFLVGYDLVEKTVTFRPKFC